MIFQHYEYALDKPPTILFRHQQGQTNNIYVYNIKIVSDDHLLGRTPKSWHFRGHYVDPPSSSIDKIFFKHFKDTIFLFFVHTGCRVEGSDDTLCVYSCYLCIWLQMLFPFPNLIYPMKDDYTKKFVILEITVVVSVEIKFELGQ